MAERDRRWIATVLAANSELERIAHLAAAIGRNANDAVKEIDLSRRLKRLGRFVILHRHPLATSGRKAELYSWREHAAFLLRWVLSGGRNLRRRDACGIWYDGRR